jgi:UDP-N-acetylglucosamine transferase subunit ALG13
MIFVTVGTDLPFDRMMRVVDQWAADTGRTDVFAQIGEAGWRPRHMTYSTFLEPALFARHFAAATTVVSHAGMGTILSALRYEKPIVVMPRMASLGEQRNDHQLATARRLSKLGIVRAAFDEHELRKQLDHCDELAAWRRIECDAQPELIRAIHSFIHAQRVGCELDPRVG